MAPLVRELSEDGVKVNVTAVFTTAQVELITEAVKDGGRPTSPCSRGGSPTPG
jgi:transaldolase